MKKLKYMKKIYHLGLITLSVLFLACGSDESKSEQSNIPTVNVTVEKIETNNTKPMLSASGKIQAKNSANLSTRMMGFVNTLHVKVGDKVQKGQLLVSINNTDLKAKAAQVSASITEATAAFNNAEKDYNRFQQLFEDNSASQKELDDISARYEMAKARLEAANQMKNEINAQFEYSNIRAPFSGVVTNTFVDEGAMANPGMPLVEVESPSSFEVKAMVPETEISQIVPDTEVDVVISAINKTIKGKVSEISTSAKNTGGQYIVTIDLGEQEAQILSGMFATVQFPVERTTKSTQMVLIPQEAIVTNGQLSGVYTVSQSNTAVLRWLRLGRTYGKQVEVLSGLSAGEIYIVSAEGKLFNGVKIQTK
jgi:RND family efflux transporter MFP subunit